MSNRERWIVYPLLALALLTSVSDKIVPESNPHFTSVTCGSLNIVTPLGRLVMQARPSEAQTGEMVLYQEQGEPVLRLGLDEHQQGAMVEGWSINHASRFRWLAHPRGSTAEWSRNESERIMMGFSPIGSSAGLWGLDVHDTPIAVGSATTAPGSSGTPSGRSTWGLTWPIDPSSDGTAAASPVANQPDSNQPDSESNSAGGNQAVDGK